ncbi:alpha/beta-hydrolase [Mycena metata]|uniref:Carboxylic ester hydrolase n=1 Tax=Mycena metata TaxID=1033252 RepID=A0AAD7MHG4_9AGAR|nr:alpha/beta-hydrolase [Mycena metata]
MLLCLWTGIVSGLCSSLYPHLRAAKPRLPPNGPLEVSLQTGTFRGVSTGKGTEKWLGIPFAEPPLRFKAPVPIKTLLFDGVRNASTFGNACPQPYFDWLNAEIAEDCLFLNIWRPENTTVDAKLPVLFWIHSGGYTNNAASNEAYDPTYIIQRSVAINKPIIFVSANYRVNTFGFLASASVPPEDLNAGLLDQRQALVFVRDHIAAFGGDPSKVTIWGQSAGAGSVQAHYIYPPAGPPLFRAGIADSSTGPFKNSPAPSTYDKAGKPFDRLLSATSCMPGSGVLECLRSIPFKKLMDISNSMIWGTMTMQLWEPTVAVGSMIPERASARVARGDFLHLPYLSGTTLNEGTIYSGPVRGRKLSGASEDAAFKAFITHTVIDASPISPDLLAKFLEMFPANDTSFGAPFNTGDSLFDRASAWYTAFMFMAPLRKFFKAGSPHQKMFAYSFRDGGGLPNGVPHGAELRYLFGPVGGADKDFGQRIRDFYLHFIHDLDPGAEWPAYNVDGKRQVMQLKRDNITMIPDDWDLEKTNFLGSQEIADQFERR